LDVEERKKRENESMADLEREDKERRQKIEEEQKRLIAVRARSDGSKCAQFE